MKKALKVVFIVLGIIVALLLVFVLTLPLTIAPIVKQAVAVGGPKAMGVEVSVGDVKFAPLSGRLVVSEVQIGNPEGYSDKQAFAVDEIEVALNVKSLLSDTIVINKVKIDAPAILFESKKGISNFETIKTHAQKMAKEKKEESQSKEKADKSDKKVIIEEFSLNHAKVSYASGVTLGQALTLPLPSIKIKDIGKQSEGVSGWEALTEVLNGLLGGLTQAVAEAVSATGKVVKDVAKEGAEAATKALESAGEGVKDAVEGIKKLNPFKK